MDIVDWVTAIGTVIVVFAALRHPLGRGEPVPRRHGSTVQSRRC